MIKINHEVIILSLFLCKKTRRHDRMLNIESYCKSKRLQQNHHSIDGSKGLVLWLPVQMRMIMKESEIILIEF